MSKQITSQGKYVTSDTDRHGNVRYYVRRAGRKIRLRAEPGTKEFEQQRLRALRTASIQKNFFRASSATGWVYFILDGNRKRVKIGYSKNPASRLEQIRTAIPAATLYYATPGNQTDEAELHRKYESIRISREWFRFSKEIRDWILADEIAREQRRNKNK